MSRQFNATASGSGPNILPPIHSESKRDRKRRETINKIEILHDESWRTRDEKFSQLYKDYHNENSAVNHQPPTAAQYLLRMYPVSIERDALLEATEIDYQYKKGQAQRAYEAERETIEGMYWDARDQVKARLLASIEERRRKLREEKEGGDVISGTSCRVCLGFRADHTEVMLEAQAKSKPIRRMALSSSAINTPASDSDVPDNDLLLHNLLAPTLAHIKTDDILAPFGSSLFVQPPVGPLVVNPNPKRGPRGKEAVKEGELIPAAGTATALAVASGQQRGRGAGAGATQAQFGVGKALTELKKMESATQLEMESDWARIQGTGGRRRTRGD